MIVIQEHLEFYDNSTKISNILKVFCLNLNKKINVCNTKTVEIAVTLKFLGKFWRNHEMSLIHWENYSISNF